ncbi:MAG: response regulator [Myxococcaceae bacterium]
MISSAPKTVLLVEDDASLREVVQELLELEGHHVLVAHDGYEGLARLQAGGIALVLLDVVMPTMDGFQFMKELERSVPRHPPVVLMTALAQGRIPVPPNACAVLRKPFDVDELLKLIQEHALAA